MFMNSETKQPPEMTWDQRLLRNAGRQKTGLKPEYQELKFTLHRKLLDRINLEALAAIDDQSACAARCGRLWPRWSKSEPTLLSSVEKQRISRRGSG